MSDYEQIRYETLDRVVRVTTNRPRYRNAQSRVLLRELDDAFTSAVADAEIRVIVLAGEGEHFSAGHDLGTPEQLEDEIAHPLTGGSDTERYFGYSWEHFLDMSLRWRDLPKPTIAQVQGSCLFGGWIIASSMDLICASDDARFLTSLLQYFSLPWDVGVRKAKEILFDTRAIDAREARDLGFVNQVWPREQLAEKTLDLANRIARQSALWLRLAKLSANQMQEAAGFRVAVQAAHSNYHLGQIDNRLQEAERIALGGAPARKLRVEAVKSLLEGKATSGGAEDP